MKLIVSNRANEKFFSLLENMKIDYIKSKDNISFNKNYFDHPDISLFYFEKTLYVENSVFSYYKNKLKNINIESVNSNFLKNKEVCLNIAFNNRFFFHNEKFTPTDIFKKLSKNKEYIKINQGYANCSMICFNNTIITSDIGIYKTLLKEKINVKLVTTDGILLNGYKNGFIGGTCGFISNDKLLFYGDVTKYKDYDIIKKIADIENVELIFPKNTDFVDLGGIISLI